MSASSPLVASSATASRVAPPRSAARRRRRREREGGARPRTTTRATFVVDSAAAASSISDEAPIAPTVAPIAPAKGAGSASQLLQDATTVDEILDAANALTLPNEERLHWHSQRIHRKKRQRAATLALTRLAKWLAPLEALATHGERERCVNDARFARLVDAAAAQFWDDDFFREVGDDDDDDDDGGSGSGAFYTLVPIRPRWRGERRSLRTFPGVSLRPPPGFNPRPRRLSTPSDAFQLHPDFRLYRTTLIRRGPRGRVDRQRQRGRGAARARVARAADGRAASQAEVRRRRASPRRARRRGDGDDAVARARRHRDGLGVRARSFLDSSHQTDPHTTAFAL